MGAPSAREVHEAVRHGRDLSGADLTHLRINQLDLTGVKAVGATLRGRWRPADVDPDSGRWSQWSDGFKLRWSTARMEGADLTDADLTWAPLQSANLRNAVLRNADLTEADCTGADFRGADLRGANLTGAVLERADLRGAQWDDTTVWPEGVGAPTP